MTYRRTTARERKDETRYAFLPSVMGGSGPAPGLKGRHRNEPCPCGLKLKRCPVEGEHRTGPLGRAASAIRRLFGGGEAKAA